MGIIYKVTNMINKNSYVGQTKYDLNYRKETHKNTYKNNITYFHKALKKYDFENFLWEVVIECNNDILDDMEKYYIHFFNTFNDGYNLTTGGEGGYERSDKTKKLMSEAAKKRIGNKNPFYGKRHSEKTKKILSKKCKENAKPISFWKDKKLSEEHKVNIGKSCKGQKNGFYGKKHSNETKQKIREARLGKPISEKTKRKMSEAHKRRIKK